MSFDYESSREKFNLIVKQYKSYLDLYRLINGGSIEGAVRFVEFYWMQTYHAKYLDNEGVSSAQM
ncbi:MAG: hypothetical protein AB8C84_00930 [Oligoflexales bacterium]